MEPLEQAEQFKLSYVPEQSDSSLKVFQGDKWLLKSSRGSILGEFRNLKAIAYPDHHSTKIVLEFDWIAHGWRTINGGTLAISLLAIDDIPLGGVMDSHLGFAACENLHNSISVQCDSDSVFPHIKAMMVHFDAATWKGC